MSLRRLLKRLKGHIIKCCCIAVIMLFFSGCAGHENVDSLSAAGSRPLSDEEAGPSGNRTILIWLLDQNEEIRQESVDELICKADREMDCDVRLEVIRSGNIHKYISESYTVRRGPDIVIGYESSPAVYADLGLTVDLTPVKHAIMELYPDEAGILQNTWIYHMKNGLQNAIPIGWSSYGILYNASVFESAGIDELPSTYDDWIETCEKLKASGYVPWISGTSKPGTPDTALTGFWTASNNAQMFSFNGRADMGNQACTEVWEFLRVNIENGYTAEKMLDYSYQEAVQMFENGNTGMFIGYLPSHLGNAENYKVMPAPRGPSAADAARNQIVRFKTCFCMRNGNDEDSLNVLTWLFSNAYLLYNDTDVIPFVSEAGQNEEEYLALRNDWKKNTFDKRNVVTLFSPSLSYPPYGEEIIRSSALSDVLKAVYSGATVQEGISYADYEINNIIDYYENR